MKKIIHFIKITTFLFLLNSCSTSDNDLKSENKNTSNNEVSIVGRWKFVNSSLTSENSMFSLDKCNKFDYIELTEDGNYIVRSGANSSHRLGADLKDFLVCSSHSFINLQKYTYNPQKKELIISNDDFDQKLDITLTTDQLIINYTSDFYQIYKRESNENKIEKPNPLFARWLFFSSSNEGNPFIEVGENSCDKDSFLIFGINGNYVTNFTMSEDSRCNSNWLFGKYTDDGSNITITPDIEGTENLFASYYIEDNFLTIDRTGDGTNLERFIRARSLENN